MKLYLRHIPRMAMILVHGVWFISADQVKKERKKQTFIAFRITSCRQRKDLCIRPLCGHGVELLVEARTGLN